MTKKPPATPASAAGDLFPETTIAPSAKEIKAQGLNFLRILRFDFLQAAQDRCGCCNRPLPSGAAYILQTKDGHEIAAGRHCTQKYGLFESDTPIPNLTRGAHKVYDAEVDPRDELNDPSALGQRTTTQWRDYASAMEYALLREERLPALGITGTSFRVTKILAQALKAGHEPKPEHINSVIGLMTSPNIPKRFTPAVLQSQYAHLMWAQRAIDSGKLTPKQGYDMTDIISKLKSRGTLTEKQHRYVQDMIRKSLDRANVPELKLGPILQKEQPKWGSKTRRPVPPDRKVPF